MITKLISSVNNKIANYDFPNVGIIQTDAVGLMFNTSTKTFFDSGIVSGFVAEDFLLLVLANIRESARYTTHSSISMN